MKKKREFSKIIFSIVMTTFIVVIIFSMVLMWVTMDTSPLVYIIPAVGTLATAEVGLYNWKAKNENLIKISREIKEEQLNIEETKKMLNETQNMLEFDINDIGESEDY